MRIFRAATGFTAFLAGVLLVSSGAIASGVSDEAKLAAFHEHMEDYEAEIVGLVGQVDAIVADFGAGTLGDAWMDDLVERWEAVAVHEAIEYKVTIAYPGIWQGIVGLQQAIQTGRSAEEVSTAAEALKAALWQGLGALRLAASQVDT